MYGVPADLDLSSFVGAILERIDLGQHILHFRFAMEPAGVISVEGDWELRTPDGHLLDQQMEPSLREAYRVHPLLGQSVTGYVVDAPTSFVLAFANGHTLRVFDRSREYESFSIQPGDIYV
ncbi:MAG: hypothetical protein K0S86_3799 [Geminicoccaceae bacterium]|nr:hypothetical protein [Geminicoccaceae bacterium]